MYGDAALDIELAGLSGIVALMKMSEEGECGGGWAVTSVEADEEADCTEMGVGVGNVVCSGGSI